MISFQCPSCSHAIRGEGFVLGDQLECPSCRAVVTIPSVLPAEDLAPVSPKNDSNQTLTVPPPADPRVTATLPPSPQSSQEVGTTADVPGYEILSELGRGAMGVVYKARHVRLNRVVALKMILSGGHASSDDQVRFLSEGEAVATFQHSNIVQVFEVGHHNNLPYMALEFIEGGSLGEKLTSGPLSAREAARLVEQLAHGMNAAHQAGIVHRDLKPDNVLLTQDGVPKITDFGLAKKVEGGHGLTQTDVIMGTPSYMAPEQASGQGKRVGPAADVYALGGILYACLTGRPPFRAGSSLDTILQVVREEPKPPVLFNPNVPKDLETICLKCLVKDPARRYASAEALGEELRRYLNDEPIQARPVGKIERALKWGKRNKTLAGSMVAVVLALLLGAGISTWQAIRATTAEALARRNEAAAKTEAQRANANERRARKKEEQATGFARKLKKSLAEVQTSVARGWCRPLVEKSHWGNAQQLLSTPEREVLQELAGTTEEPMRMKFIREALRSPLTIRQLRNRSKYVMIAAVGLDRLRREAVEGKLLARLQKGDLTADEKLDLALTLQSLGGLSPPAANQVVGTLIQDIPELGEFSVERRLLKRFSSVTAQMEPQQATQAARLITQLMTRTTRARRLAQLTQVLSCVAQRLEPQEAAQCANTLGNAMNKTKDPHAWGHLCVGLSLLAERMDSQDASKLCREAVRNLTNAMNTTTDHGTLVFQAQPLSSLVQYLPPKQAVAAFYLATTTQNGRQFHQYFAQGFSAMGKRMSPEDAAEAARTLINSLSKMPNSKGMIYLPEIFVSLAERMKPEDVAKTANAVAAATTKSTNSFERQYLSKVLSLLAERMEPEAGAELSSQVAITLSQAIKANNRSAPNYLSLGLVSLARRLPPQQAAPILIQAMLNTKDANSAIHSLSTHLASVIPQMQPQAAAQAAEMITQGMINTTYPPFLSALSKSLSLLAQRMTPEDATRFGNTLANAMTKVRNEYTRQYLSEGLSSLAPRMQPAAAAQAAKLLMGAISTTTRPSALQSLCKCLSSLAGRMEPKEGSKICYQAVKQLRNTRTKRMAVFSQKATRLYCLSLLAGQMEPTKAVGMLSNAMARTTEGQNLRSLSKGWSLVADRMESQEAAKLCLPAAEKIANRLVQTTDPSIIAPLCASLASIVQPLDSKDASKLCARAVAFGVRVMSKTTDPSVQRSLPQSLASMAERMNSEDVARAIEAIQHALAEPLSTDGLDGLARVLSAMAQRVPPTQGATVLTRAISEVKSYYAQKYLSQGLSSVVQRMDPKEGTATLINALNKTPHPFGRRYLSEGLSAMSQRMDTEDAAKAFEALVEAMTRAYQYETLESIHQALVVTATRANSAEQQLRVMSLVSGIGQGPTQLTHEQDCRCCHSQ